MKIQFVTVFFFTDCFAGWPQTDTANSAVCPCEKDGHAAVSVWTLHGSGHNVGHSVQNGKRQ